MYIESKFSVPSIVFPECYSKFKILKSKINWVLFRWRCWAPRVSITGLMGYIERYLRTISLDFVKVNRQNWQFTVRLKFLQVYILIKAFDMVEHYLLVEELNYFCIRGLSLDLTRSYLKLESFLIKFLGTYIDSKLNCNLLIVNFY